VAQRLVGKSSTGSLLLLAVSFALLGCVEKDPAAEEQGIVLSAQPTQQAGENTGVGAVAGMVVGVTLGAAVGGQGVGQVASAVAGEIVGGAAGAAAESATQRPTGISYAIKLNDGRVITVVEHHPSGAPIFAAQTPVTIETRGDKQHVEASGIPSQ